MLIRSFALAVAAGLALSQAQQQQSLPPAPQQQAPVFRSAIDLVPITVTVTDQKGQPVTGLTQKDFRVIEDGKAREIAGFFPQTLTAISNAPPPVPDVTRGRGSKLEPAARRTFLIVPAFARIQEPTKALDGAVAFVRERLLPQDAVAVMAFHRVTTFTTDHEAIIEVLRRYKKEHERIFWDMSQYLVRTRVPPPPAPLQSFGRLDIEYELGLPRAGGPPLPAEMLADIDRVLFEGAVPKSALRNSADLLLGMDLATTTGDRSYKRQYVFSELLTWLQALGLSLTDALVQSSPLKLFAGIEHLRFMDGEKHLVYMGGGAPLIYRNDADLARLFAARANDARVVVDYLGTGGTTRVGSGCQGCRDLSELTGGFYTSLDMMEAALAKVDQRSRSFYLIGYVPGNTAMDGQYRHVRVEVDRPGVTVSYRRGYFASEDTPPLELKQIVAATRADTLATFDENVTDIGIGLEAAVEPAAGGGKPQVRVDVNVDISALGIGPVDGLHTGRLEVTVYCGDDKQKVIGETKVAWNLRADPETFAYWLRNGLQRTLRVPVTGKPKFVKVIVYDTVSDRTGSMTATIR